MKKFLYSIWGIPLLTILCYTCIYIYKLSYLRTFDISGSFVTVLLEDFFIPGIILFAFFIMFFTALRIKTEEKPTFGLLEVIKERGSLSVMLFTTIVPFLMSSLAGQDLIYRIFLALIASFLCFAFRLISKEVIDSKTWTDIIITIILAFSLSWVLGLFGASGKKEFLSIE
mgnify:CR=1 FL=1